MTNNAESLPGESEVLTTSIREASVVLVAQAVTEGTHEFGGTGTWIYRDAEFDISESLSGKEIGRIKCSYIAVVFPPEKKEATPAPGTNYILIGTRTSDAYSIGKFLKATPENVQEVRRLLSEVSTTSHGQQPNPALPNKKNEQQSQSVNKSAPVSLAEITPGKAETRGKQFLVWLSIGVVAVIAVVSLWLYKSRYR